MCLNSAEFQVSYAIKFKPIIFYHSENEFFGSTPILVKLLNVLCEPRSLVCCYALSSFLFNVLLNVYSPCICNVTSLKGFSLILKITTQLGSLPWTIIFLELVLSLASPINIHSLGVGRKNNQSSKSLYLAFIQSQFIVFTFLFLKDKKMKASI